MKPLPRHFFFRPQGRALGAGVGYARVATERRGPHALAETTWSVHYGELPPVKPGDVSETAVMVLLTVMTAVRTYTAEPVRLGPMLANMVAQGAPLPIEAIDGSDLYATDTCMTGPAVLTGPYSNDMPEPGMC